MKKSILFLASFLLSILFYSCSKTMSTDLPLPLVHKQAIYVSTENNNLISFDANKGNKNWEVNFKGIVDGSPTLYNSKVYCVTKNGYFYVVDVLTGKIVTEKSIGVNTVHSTVVYKDRIYISADKLYCYDLSGNQIWSYNTYTNCSTSPTITNDNIFVGASDTCYKIDLNGSIVWKYTTQLNLPIQSSPKVTNGLVYFGCKDNKLYAITESTGILKWNYQMNDEVVSSPMVYGGMCIVGCNDYSIYCIDTTLGALRWKLPSAERIISSPTVHEFSKTILVGSYDFNLYAIDHVTGDLKWKYPTGSLIKSSPVVMGDNVYFSSYDKYIYCVNVYSGKTVWKSFINGISQSSPVADDAIEGVHSSISGMSKY